MDKVEEEEPCVHDPTSWNIAALRFGLKTNALRYKSHFSTAQIQKN